MALVCNCQGCNEDDETKRFNLRCWPSLGGLHQHDIERTM